MQKIALFMMSISLCFASNVSGMAVGFKSVPRALTKRDLKKIHTWSKKCISSNSCDANGYQPTLCEKNYHELNRTRITSKDDIKYLQENITANLRKDPRNNASDVCEPFDERNNFFDREYDFYKKGQFVDIDIIDRENNVHKSHQYALARYSEYFRRLSKDPAHIKSLTLPLSSEAMTFLFNFIYYPSRNRFDNAIAWDVFFELHQFSQEYLLNSNLQQALKHAQFFIKPDGIAQTIDQIFSLNDDEMLRLFADNIDGPDISLAFVNRLPNFSRTNKETVDFHPKKSHIVAVGNDGFASVIDAISGAIINRLESQKPLKSVIYAGHGNHILGNTDWSFIIWDARSGAIIYQAPYFATAISPDGTQVIIKNAEKSEHGPAQILDVASGQKRFLCNTPSHARSCSVCRINHAVFSQDGREIAALSDISKPSITVLDARVGTTLATFYSPQSFGTSMVLSPEGKFVISPTLKELYIYGVGNKTETKLTNPKFFNWVGFSFDNRHMFIATYDTAEIFDLESMTKIESINMPPSKRSSHLKVNRDRTLLFAIDQTNELAANNLDIFALAPAELASTTPMLKAPRADAKMWLLLKYLLKQSCKKDDAEKAHDEFNRLRLSLPMVTQTALNNFITQRSALAAYLDRLFR